MEKQKLLTGLQFLKDLEEHSFTRLAPVTHGVGVIAIRKIPKGTDPFKGVLEFKFRKVRVEKVLGNPNLTDGVKKLVRDMCPEEDGYYYVPSYSINEIGIGYYLNHSSTPNMGEVKGGEDFVALRDIEIGEELTVDYGTYSELNLDD
jgi:SET domain-containing protein